MTAPGLYMAWELVAKSPVAFLLLLVMNGKSDPQSFVSGLYVLERLASVHFKNRRKEE